MAGTVSLDKYQQLKEDKTALVKACKSAVDTLRWLHGRSVVNGHIESELDLSTDIAELEAVLMSVMRRRTPAPPKEAD